jgi:phosphate transport system permease protein
VNTGYYILILLGGVLPLAYMAFALGRRKALAYSEQGEKLHSQAGFYGWYAFLWMFLPPIAISVLFCILHLAGLVVVPGTMLAAASLGLAAGGLFLALRTIRPGLRARKHVEGVIAWILFIAAGISILTTVGIVLSILFEAIRFFQMINLWEFLTGTQWSPGTAFLSGAGRAGEEAAKPEFGSLPIFAGTFMITFIAMCVALPVGLFAAIFMSEYASLRVRGFAKPVLEILAGIPTVVYGFFAAITVSPFVVRAAESLGLEADYTNALSPGIVMGIMIIPFISSLSDDVINSIPQSMREGSFALGTTRSETIKHVVVPAALPGIVSAFLLAVSRALGETMIVVMAAGLRPNLTWNPLEGMTTVTVRIVDALTGDTSFDSAETLSAFGLGITLLVVTLSLNIVSTVVIRRFKQQYEL